MPSQAVVQFVNSLPNSIEKAPSLKTFKRPPNEFLITERFYNTDELFIFTFEHMIDGGTRNKPTVGLK